LIPPPNLGSYIDCIDAEFLVQQMHALWAQAWQSQQSRDPR
jgi:hypothetical protein